MINGELRKILERFPITGTVKVRRAGRDTQAEDIDRAEMAIDASPLRLTEQNVAWIDLIQEKVGLVLIIGEPKVELVKDRQD